MSSPAPRKVLQRLAGGVFFVLLLCGPVIAVPESESVGVVEHLGTKIPLDIIFRDEAGTPVILSDLVKGPTIILPVYYRCSNVCFTLQGHFANALQRLERRPLDDYRVISVSFDEEETPVMAARSRHAYLSAMKKPFPEEGWRFLTGDLSSIRRLTDALGFGFQRQRHEFAHPVATIVVAGDGTIVRYLYGVSILPKDLALALVEARSGIAGGSIHKLMDYCFTFDPVGRTYVFNLLRVSATAVILCTGGFLLFLILTGRKRKQRIREK
ncbi:MAG: SCO family protein [Geobacteraceae bacterium]|nr:SCO family protein [Geobacteraceae bacterium]